MCPCKGCESRQLSCHSKCDEYKAWKAERDEINRKRISEREQREISHDHEMKYRKNLKQGRRRA